MVLVFHAVQPADRNRPGQDWREIDAEAWYLIHFSSCVISPAVADPHSQAA